MVSDKVDFLAGNCMGAMPDNYELILLGTREAGRDELLINSIKRLGIGQRRHSSAGRAADL
jgi:hypothetical protein